MENAICIKHLVKDFGSKKAVNDINLTLKTGEIFGFLGPNGAGKTTTIKLLNGMLMPTGGELSVFGIDPAKNPEQIHKIAGILTEHAGMYDELTGMENLIFYGNIFGINKEDAEKLGLKLLEQLDLASAKDKKLGTYSTGMRQRLSLARALIHSPKLLFLDEPTSGLDPESAQKVNELIKELAKHHGTTVFLCTHQLRYAQEICTRYGLIDEGVMFATGSLEDLRNQVSTGHKMRIKSTIKPSGEDVVMIETGIYECHVNNEEDIALKVEEIVKSGGRVFHVLAIELTLEEIYFELTRRLGKGGQAHA